MMQTHFNSKPAPGLITPGMVLGAARNIDNPARAFSAPGADVVRFSGDVAPDLLEKRMRMMTHVFYRNGSDLEEKVTGADIFDAVSKLAEHRKLRASQPQAGSSLFSPGKLAAGLGLGGGAVMTALSHIPRLGITFGLGLAAVTALAAGGAAVVRWAQQDRIQDLFDFLPLKYSERSESEWGQLTDSVNEAVTALNRQGFVSFRPMRLTQKGQGFLAEVLKQPAVIQLRIDRVRKTIEGRIGEYKTMKNDREAGLVDLRANFDKKEASLKQLKAQLSREEEALEALFRAFDAEPDETRKKEKLEPQLLIQARETEETRDRVNQATAQLAELRTMVDTHRELVEASVRELNQNIGELTEHLERLDLQEIREQALALVSEQKAKLDKGDAVNTQLRENLVIYHAKQYALEGEQTPVKRQAADLVEKALAERLLARSRAALAEKKENTAAS